MAARWALVAVWVLLGACSSTSSTSAPVPESNAQVELGCDLHPQWDDGADLIFFLQPDATAKEIADFEAELGASADVESMAFVDQAEALRNFRELFKDAPQVASSVTLKDMPPSFEVVVNSSAVETASELAASFVGDGRIYETVERPRVCPPTPQELQAICDALPHEASVFLNPNEPQAAIDRIANRLVASPDVDTITFVDKAEAYEEFLQNFPLQATSVTEADMPPGFTIVGDANALDPLLDDLRGDPAIFEIVDSGCS